MSLHAKEQIIEVLTGAGPLMLHEIQTAIERSYGTMHSECALSARIRELRRKYGYDIRSKPRGKSNAHEYWLVRTEQLELRV